MKQIHKRNTKQINQMVLKYSIIKFNQDNNSSISRTSSIISTAKQILISMKKRNSLVENMCLSKTKN